jgi:subtilisin family serine protease
MLARVVGRKYIRRVARALWLLPSPVLLALPLAPAPASAQAQVGQIVSAALAAEMAAYPLERIPIIVEMSAPRAPFATPVSVSLAQQAVNILNTYGQAVGALSVIQGAAGYATSAGIQAMSQLPQVAAIEQDAVVRPRRSAGVAPAWPAGQLTSLYPQEVNATRVWQQGGSGLGVTVAVLDSGIAADPDLGNRIQAEVGFAGPFDPQRPDLGGHGTHIAGTIAGDGTRSSGQYVGIAPRANLVSIQVLGKNGNGRISSVLRGIEWAIAHKAQYNIRVLNLSFGARPLGSYKTDPLAAAVEIAWKQGIVVVAAAGNGGPSGGTVESPGVDPYIITVGATDDQATLTLNDDTLAWFSAWGTPTDSTAKPDMLGAGRRVVSLRVPGSSIDTMLPDHVVMASNGNTYTRLTGTSMATAVVSGAAALLLERQPALKPDQVKQTLTRTSQSFGQSTSTAGAGSGQSAGAGAGLLDAYAAATSLPRGSANAGLRVADGAARMLYASLYGQPLAWNAATYLGTNWTQFTWLTLPWTSATWDNIAWDNIAWDNIAWDNIAWDNIAWDNIAWDNIAWDDTEWNNIAWDSFNTD